VAVLEEAALWSVALGAFGVCAGGFTGAFEPSGWAPACVVAAGAFALLVSGVAVLLLPVAGGVLPAVALLSGEAVGAGPAVAAPAAAPAAAPSAAPVLAWLLVQESEIMLTELTWMEPSLARDPWICTW